MGVLGAANGLVCTLAQRVLLPPLGLWQPLVLVVLEGALAVVGLAVEPAGGQPPLDRVVLLLGHRFPKVRKSAADLFYVHLLTYGDPGELEPMPDEESGISEEPMAAGDARLEVIMSALLETAWLGSLDQNAKPARAKVLSALGLPPPKVLAAAPAAPKKVEEDTYKELVGEMGY